MRTHFRVGLRRRLRTVFLAGAMALSLGPKPAEGQVLLGWLMGEFLTTETFNVGFDIGLNISTLTGLENAKRVNGTLFGLFGEWRFHPNIHLQPGVILVSKKGAEEIDPIAFDDPELDPIVTGGTMTRELNMIDFPILLQYATGPDKGLRFGVGPQFNLITGARDRYEGLTSAGARDRYEGLTSDGSTVTIEQDLDDRLKGFEAGMAFDFEIQISPALGIGVRYFHGLTDMDDTPGFTSMSRVLSGSGRIALGRGSSN